ncbi:MULTISPECIES: YjcZ family sporulation protein [unclassified Sporolactobacillus]|uniref:YjcZ family sporulation protein n=1 Tax=unclassified Sporolactobacillus TaxID=2628533 RepID=UPI002367AC93|nr:YjcZ family sporulation protein [Sporolactobacillus sp. CQH2019]MDD9147240.1 YjcZ family sporulation protein [Sporolactobacillus sp. CQH2019]
MGYYGLGGNPSNAAYGGYGYGYGCQPHYPVGGYSYGSGFALIVVLFILLIIVGAAFVC